MKGVIKNMKEQFLNLSGLTELVTYIKLCIAQHKMIIPRASFSLFPKTGDENNIYIDTSTNSIYRWNDSDKSFVLLAKPPRNISISEGKNNGQITLKVDEIESNATVHGLKSAAFSNASSFATSAQGAKADSAIQSITIAPGTNNGTVKITVNGVTTDNIKVAGLGSAAFSDIAVFAPAKHTHSKSDVGLGNVDNTADANKSVKYAGSSGSSNTVVYTALTNTDLNTLQTEGRWYYAGGGNTCTNIPVASAAFELYVGRNASGWRYQQFTVTSGEIYIRVFDSSNWGSWRKLAFTSDTVTAASSVPWSGITGKPTTFTPASHTHNYAGSSSAGGTANASYKLSNVGQITTVDALNNFNEANVFKYATMSALDGLNGLGKNDGIILSAPWSSANYGHQIFLDDNSYTIAHRYRNSGTWSAWKTLIDSSNIGSQSVSHASTADSTTTATQLSSSAGSATQPVYFSGGKPVATTYTLGKSVPSNAVFTDTNTWRGIQNNLTSDSTTDSLSAAQGKVLKGLVDGKAASSHTHAIAQISNLQSTLDGKSNTNHTHDLNSMINTLTNGASDPVDTDYYIAQYAGGGSTTTTYHRRPHSALWNYIKSKANSVYQPKGSYAASSHTHDDRYYTESEINTKLASKSDTSHKHNYVVGSYTGNGGQQKPNYFGTNKVGFLMMNTTVNGDSNYKDWIIMDCYSSNDVGGSVALGVNRQKLAAYIMRSAAERSSWAESAELLHTLNYTSYTVTKTGSGASGTWGISISGNATTSTKLATARSINGTNFDGSGNITTATWGTARTLTIGNTGKSVNGGGNVSWSLSEIGAAASNHTHSYLPLSGGAMTGNISYRGSKATYKMIEFIDNSSDEYGNGIAIGGGGLTIIGGGESADVVKSTSTRGGDERLILANDGAIDIYTNCQNGIDKATHITIDNTGLYSGTAAKANSVPWSGVTGKPSTYTPSSHNHTVIQGTSSTSAVPGKANDGFCEFYYNVNNGLANNMPSSNNANAIISISRHAGDYTSQLGFSSNGNLYYREGVGATAWKTILTSSNYTSYTVTKTGGGASGTWGINITGSAGSVAWGNVSGKPSSYTPSSHTHDDRYYTETEINTKLGTKLGAVSANGYYGMARPDGNTSDWIRTTTAGIIPYQSGGAGAGHCGLGTSSWYFSNAYIDTVNCVNTNASGYLQANGLINTYSEYQSQKGSRDWRFGSATGNGDQNWFGFYDYTYGFHGGWYGPTHSFRANGEIISTNANAFRAVYGNYGFIIRNDGISTYFLQTASGDPYGSWNNNYSYIDNGTGQWVLRDNKGNREFPVLASTNATYRVVRIQKSGNNFRFDDDGGTARYCTGSTSDIRLKKNIEDTEILNALSVVNSMKIRSFDWKENNEHQKIGFIADELEKLDSKLVFGGGETENGGINAKVVDTFYLLGYVVKSIQELSSQVSSLKEENKLLKQKLETKAM